MALDTEGSLCLQQNQSNLHSQQAQIQGAAVAFWHRSVQQFAQVFNVVIKSYAVKHLQTILYLCKCLFPESYFACSFSQKHLVIPYTTDGHGSCFFHWLGFKQQPKLQLHWDLMFMWSPRSVCRNKHYKSPEACSRWCYIGSIPRTEHGRGAYRCRLYRIMLNIYMNSVVHWWPGVLNYN